MFNYPGHAAALAIKAGALLSKGDVTIARVDRSGRLLGGVIFTSFTTRAISIHVGSFAPRWVSRNLLYTVFQYPFNQLGVEKVIGQVPEHNQAAVKFNLKVGFTLETKVSDVFPEGDMLIMSMYRKDCRHLSIRPRWDEEDIMQHGRI